MIRTVAVDALVNLGLQGASVFLGLVIGVVLSRLLGAEGLGVYAFAMSMAMLLGTVSRLGLTTLLVREVAAGVERQDADGALSLVSWAQRLSFRVSVAVALVALCVTASVAAPETTRTVGIAMVVLVFMTGATVRSAALRGLNAVVVASLPLHVVRPVVTLVGLLGLLSLAKIHPWQAMGASALAWFAAGAVAFGLWVRRAPDGVVSPPINARKWLNAALPLLLLDGLLVTIHQSDVLMLKWLANDASTGIYSIVSQLGRLTALVLVAANGVVSPRFSALHTAGDRAGLQRLVRASALGVTVLTLGLAVALIGLGPRVLALYAPGFEAGYPALVVLVLGQALNALAGSVGLLLVMTGHDGDVAKVSAGVAVLNITLNFALIPHFDMVGAAIASALSIVIWNFILVVVVRKRLKLNSSAIGWRL